MPAADKGPGAGSQPQITVTAPVWDSKATQALKSGFASARGAPPQSLRPKAPGPSGLSQQMTNMDISGPAPQRNGQNMCNASLAPAPSAMTNYGRPSNAPSRATGKSSRAAGQNNPFCKLSNYTRQSFKLGNVLSLPFHTPNTNPLATDKDPNLNYTPHGYTYSKRRMVVVLFAHSQDLYCLPLYSFEGRGIIAKPEWIRHEYVCLISDGDEAGFVNDGPHQPVTVNMRTSPIDDTTTVHLTGDIKVGCNENIGIVGRLTRDSYYNLKQLWDNSVKQATKDQW